MKPFGISALLCVAVLLMVTAWLPMRAALALIGGGDLFAVRAAEGTIWRGILRDVSFDGVGLGDFSAALHPASLFAGRAAIKLTSETGEPMKATLLASLSDYGASEVTARLVLPGAFDPLPIDMVELRDSSVRFSSDGCVSANGQVRVTLTGNFAGLPLGQELLGNLRCDGKILSVALIGQSAMERITLRIAPDGQYSATMAIKASDATMAAQLNAAGLRETAAGHIVELSGRL